MVSNALQQHFHFVVGSVLQVQGLSLNEANIVLEIQWGLSRTDLASWQ